MCKLTDDDIITRYVNGEATAAISVVAGVTDRSVRRILTKHNVATRKGNRIYEIDEGFFKTWTPNMAYILGFILTDGTVSGTTASIHQKDKTILELIGKALKFNAPVRKRQNGKSHIHSLTINRKEMVDDLLALGITENKSLSVSFPDVPEDYLPHFIRGVIDGDGWVHEKGYTMNVTSGSYAFSAALLNVLLKQKYNARLETYNYGGNDVHRVWVSGKNDIIRLGQWLYADCGILYLPRKRERFEINAA